MTDVKPGDVIRIRWHGKTRPARVVSVTPDKVRARAIDPRTGKLNRWAEPYGRSWYVLPAEPGDREVIEAAEQEASPPTPPTPRYLVYAGKRLFKTCATLAEAIDWKDKIGGLVYELVEMVAAEMVAKEAAYSTQGVVPQ